MNIKKTIWIFVVAVFATATWLYFKGKEKAIPIAKEKVLVTASISFIKTLDPIHCDDSYSARETAKIYEGLLQYHYLKRPLELIPSLAEEMPTISEDQLVYTFKIKKGIMFHDNKCFPNGKGRELTAHDFVYSFKRLADPHQQSANFWLIDGKIKGLAKWREHYSDAGKIDYAEEIEGIKALDRYTIAFSLTRPCSQFLYVLTMMGCSAVPHEAVEYYGPEFMNHPVGTGPFMLEVFNPQDTQIVYHKNPNFRDEYFPKEAAEEYKHLLVAYAGKKLPFVDKIITHIINEEQPRWLKFKKGHLDFLDLTRDQTASTVLDSKNELVQSLHEKGMKIFQIPSISTSYIIFNNYLDLFKNNPKLRQAIAMSLDIEAYNKLFHEGRAIIAQSTVPPGLAGYQKNYVNPYQYNVEKAKQYLAEAGYPDGKGLPEITLDIPLGTTFRQKGEFFQKYMQKIGIKVKIIENIFPELLKKSFNKTTMLHTISWSATYPDAEIFFNLFYGPNEPGLGIHFNDPTFNALYEKTSLMNDTPARTALYEQMNQLLGEQVPSVFLVHHQNIFIQQGWLKNYCWSDFHYGTEKYFDIDMEQKAALSSKL